VLILNLQLGDLTVKSSRLSALPQKITTMADFRTRDCSGRLCWATP
jgi:hypothetical protein